MTENTTTQAVETASTFADLDPRTLVIEANVRTDVDLDPAFVESIRDNGVLMPILVQRHEDGTLHVRAGQRRTLGAVAAERPTIPARIIEGTSDDAERIVQQVIENDARKPLADTERSAAYQQMALLPSRRDHRPPPAQAEGRGRSRDRRRRFPRRARRRQRRTVPASRRRRVQSLVAMPR